jgi:hypothetical protein
MEGDYRREGLWKRGALSSSIAVGVYRGNAFVLERCRVQHAEQRTYIFARSWRRPKRSQAIIEARSKGHPERAFNKRQDVKKMNLLLLSATLLAGCATRSPDVVTYYDPHTKTRTDLISENMLETEGPPREIIWLNASRVFHNPKNYQYYLEVDYLSHADTGLLEIPPGESLVILADGQELKFRGSGSANSRRERKNEVSERAIYSATGEQLRTIAGARDVKVSVIGRNGIVQREFRQLNFEKFRHFVTEYVTHW